MATKGPGIAAGSSKSSTLLIFAWAISLVLVAGIALTLQLTYDAPVKQVSEETGPAPQQSAADDLQPGSSPDAEGGDGSTGSTGSTGGTGDAEPGSSSLSDPAQAQTTQSQTNQLETSPSVQGPGSRVADTSAVSARTQRRSAAPDLATPSFVQLASAPDPGLVENGPYGPLPIRGSDGRQPWQVYARPVALDDDMPRIAIVISNIGLSSRVSQAAVEGLPPDVTLALSPYASDPAQWARDARSAGHEILLMIPTEPMQYPDNDPGPHTLLADGPAVANVDRLAYLLSRMPGYVGVINHMGSRFTAKRDALDPLMMELARRGLMFVDARSSRFSVAAAAARDYQVPRASNTRYIDNVQDGAEIDRQLQELENVAQTLGAAVGIGRAFPITIDRVTAWQAELSAKGIALVPVSAVANRQAIR